MPRKGRQVPPDEDRGARNRALSVYLSEEEHADLEKLAETLGFRSKSHLAAYVLGAAIEGGFSGWTFVKIGNNFAQLIEDSGKGTVNIPMPRFWRKQATQEEGKPE